MSIAVPSTLRRWAIPGAVALAVIGGGVAVGAITNAADNTRPPRSAQDLLVDLQTAHVDGLQGTVVARADLGLPPLGVPSAGSADLSSLASGTHTLRVWYADPKQARVALLGTGGETDVITNGDDLWIWSSAKNTGTHAKLPAGGLAGLLGGAMMGGGMMGGAGAPSALPSGLPTDLPSGLLGGLTPESIAQMALSFLQQSTDVTTDSNASVAGRAADELTLTPRDTNSLIGSIVIDMDAEQHIPLRFAVLTRAGGAPAIEIAFSDISFTRPDVSQFTFNPPPGATVVEEPSSSGDAAAVPDAHTSGKPDLSGNPPFTISGTGWTSVVVVHLPDGFADSSGLGSVVGMLPPVSGDWGSGHLLQTRLVSVLITDDGRLLAGAVGPEQLYAAAKN